MPTRAKAFFDTPCKCATRLRYVPTPQPTIKNSNTRYADGASVSRRGLFLSDEQVRGEQFTEQYADFHDIQYRIYQAGSEDFTPLLADGKCAFTDIYSGNRLIFDTAI